MTRKKAEQIARILNVISFVAMVGVIVPGILGRTAIMNVFSVVGIGCFFAGLLFWLRFPESFHYETNKELRKKGLDSKYESIAYPLMLPGCALALMLLKSGNIKSWWVLLVAGAVLFVILCILIHRFVPELRENMLELVGMALVLAIFQVGSIWQVNMLLDFKEPEYTEVEVIRKDSSHSRRGGTTYYFMTELEGEEYRFHVTSDEWRALDAGDTVTVAIHSGGLGMEYYTLEEP